MRNRYLVLALAILCFGAAACDDDDPVKPEEFAVAFVVKDLAGEPVEGLRVHILNDNPYMQDGGLGAKAVCAIPFLTEIPVHINYTIEDIEGRVIRNLYEGDIERGHHRIHWDGLDDAGDHQPSGRYTVHVVCTNIETGYWVFEDRTDMLLAMLDASRVPAGFTDKNGRLVLKDKTLFPHLYDLPNMQATNENGEMMGEIELTAVMRISLGDTLNGGGMWFKRVVNESETVNLTWAPPPPNAAQATKPGPLFPGVAKVDTTFPELFLLGRVYPNPFN